MGPMTLTKIAATLATAVLLAACGSSPGTDPVPVPQEDVERIEQDSGGAEVEAGTHDGGEMTLAEWEQEYRRVTEITDQLEAAGVCQVEPDAEPFETAYSAESMDCGSDYTAAVYASPQQQSEAATYLPEINPGTTIVWGTGWSVWVPYPSDGSEVVDVLGGEAVAP